MMWLFHPLSLWAFGSHVAPVEPVADPFAGRMVRKHAAAAGDLLRPNTQVKGDMVR